MMSATDSETTHDTETASDTNTNTNTNTNTDTDTDTADPVRSVSDWADDHRIDGWMLPLRTRKENPVELISKIKSYLDSIPKTQATLTSTNIGIEFISGYAKPLQALFRLRPVSSVHRRNRFVNPNYCHLGHHEQPITDEADRLQFYERYADSPHVDGDWFATNFGITEGAFYKFGTRHGLDYGQRKLESRKQCGRTLWTIFNWTDYSAKALAKKMPTATRSTERWMYRYGRDADDWEVPDRPRTEPWYSSSLTALQRELHNDHGRTPGRF